MDRQLKTLKLEIDQLNASVAAADPLLHSKLDVYEQTREARAVYSSETRSAALWLGFCIGVALALVGVRVLGSIFSDQLLSDMQLNLFVWVDILFTGSVLAGGSEGMHQIMKIYNSFTHKVEARNIAARGEG